MKGFEFKKKFGQNFIRDENLLQKIVDAAQVSADDVVLEIGAGAGALTAVLARRAKKVIAFEIDRELIPVLTEKFEGTNVELVFEDVMNFSETQIKSLAGGKFKLVANLPYYITSPILTKFLQISYLSSATVMVQEEVADRIVAEPKTKDYGVLTLICKMFGEPQKMLRVGREMFTPMPKVDSAVVRIVKEEKLPEIDANAFFDLVKRAFSNRRKKMSSNLGDSQAQKQEIEQWLQANGHSPLARAEELSPEDFLSLFEFLKKSPLEK